jgi:cell division transport system ATP-binding protein
MIQLINVGKRYDRQHALNDISFQVEKGSMVFISGHSGAGKTTLLKLIGYIEAASAGQVVVNGYNLKRMRRRAIPYFRRKIGMVFQDYRLLNDRSVFDNVAFPLAIAGYRHNEIASRVRAVLTRVGLLKKAHVYPFTLSGGEQQRVGIARAVVNKPDILLADEPTGNLDPELSLEIMKLFEEFNQIGTTVMIASHDKSLIEHMHYPVIWLKNGMLESVANNPETHH